VKSSADKDTANILICNSDAELNGQLKELFGALNYQLDFINKLTDAIKKILTCSYDVIILELDSDKEGGAETIPIINQIDSSLPIITITSEDSLETQRKVRKGKIFYYLVKPLSGEEIISALRHAVARHCER
jgi:DNA-binding response OmpR family regulator